MDGEILTINSYQRQNPGGIPRTGYFGRYTSVGEAERQCQVVMRRHIRGWLCGLTLLGLDDPQMAQ